MYHFDEIISSGTEVIRPLKYRIVTNILDIKVVIQLLSYIYLRL